MEEKISRVFEEREQRKEVTKYKYMIEHKLYSTEYLEDIDNKFIRITTNEIIANIHDIEVVCRRIEDNKLVQLSKIGRGEQYNQGKRYVLNVPIEIEDDVYKDLIDGEEDKQTNSLIKVLKGFAIFFYLLAALSVLVSFFIMTSESGIVFFGVLSGAAFIAFFGLVLHALAYILINVISVNRKLDK